MRRALDHKTLIDPAWLVVLLLMPVALLNYLDRQMLASMKTSVMADIPSIGTQANWGYMLGQFKWVYAFLSPIGGYVADRFSRRWTIGMSLFVWSGVTWWTGRVNTFDQLILARSLMGISEAFYIPAALALIADYHPGATRSRAVSLHQVAIYCGAIAGGFGGYVADEPSLGWRSAFFGCGLVGMFYALPLVLLLRDRRRTSAPATSLQLSPFISKDASSSSSSLPPATSPPEKSPPATSPPATSTKPITLVASIGELLLNPSFLLLVLYFTLPALAGWVVRDWMPAILLERFQIGQGIAGVTATTYWQVAAILSAMVGGYLADRWMRRTIRGRIYVSALGMTLIVPAIFGVGNASSLSMAVSFLVLFGLGWGLFDGNNMPILSQIVRPQLRATGYGIMNLVSISCGGLADWAFGLMRDRQTPVNVIFTVFASACVVSVVLVLLIRPRRYSEESE